MKIISRFRRSSISSNPVSISNRVIFPSCSSFRSLAISARALAESSMASFAFFCLSDAVFVRPRFFAVMLDSQVDQIETAKRKGLSFAAQAHAPEQCPEPRIAAQIVQQGVRLDVEHSGMVLSIGNIEPLEGGVTLRAVGVDL